MREIASNLIKNDTALFYLSALYTAAELYSMPQKQIVHSVFTPFMFSIIEAFPSTQNASEFIRCYGFYYRSFFKFNNFPQKNVYLDLLNSKLLEDDLNYFDSVCQLSIQLLVNNKNANTCYQLLHCRAVNVFKSQAQLPISFFELVKSLVKQDYKQNEMDWISNILVNEVDRMQIETIRIILEIINLSRMTDIRRFVEKLVQAWNYSEYALLKDDILDTLWKLAQLNSELFTETILTIGKQRNIASENIYSYFNQVDTNYTFKQAMFNTVLKHISIQG